MAKVVIGLDILVISNLILSNSILKQLALFILGFCSNNLDYIDYI